MVQWRIYCFKSQELSILVLLPPLSNSIILGKLISISVSFFFFFFIVFFVFCVLFFDIVDKGTVLNEEN